MLKKTYNYFWRTPSFLAKGVPVKNIISGFLAGGVMNHG